MKMIYTYSNLLYAALLAAYLRFHLDFSVNWRKIRKHKGIFHYIGLDSNYNEIFVVYIGKNKWIFYNLMSGLEKLYEEPSKIINPYQLYGEVMKRIHVSILNRIKGWLG